MWYWCFCLLLLQQVDPSAAVQSETPQATSAPTTQEGPMRVELLGIREIREAYLDPQIDRPVRSQLQLGLQVAGTRVLEIVKVGNVIFSEVVDDTGKSLIGPDTYSEAVRTTMRPMEVTPETLRRGGLRLSSSLEPAARKAATITKAKGTLRVLYANETEEITIVNPRELMGSIIAHPRLKELGIEIRVMPAGDPRSVPPRDMFISLQYLSKENHIAGVEFYDAWMKPMLARPRPMKTNDDQDCMVFQVSRGKLDTDSQMVIQIYPTLDEAVIEAEFEDIPLP
jgi:hypothetical protein